MGQIQSDVHPQEEEHNDHVGDDNKKNGDDNPYSSMDALIAGDNDSFADVFPFFFPTNVMFNLAGAFSSSKWVVAKIKVAILFD